MNEFLAEVNVSTTQLIDVEIWPNFESAPPNASSTFAVKSWMRNQKVSAVA